MALTPGTRIGSCEIAERIGVGGMGEVYRATDTNLKRQVAIKVLPEAVAADAERLARLQREAEVLASLNHPNIAAIFGLERTGTTTALVMELVEGPTLAGRIAGGPIPVNEALAIAKQIAEALEAAHEQGVIHRDLKPANIKLRPDGAVKVLDFGLAKAMEPAHATSPGLTQSPTITTPAMTQAGLILGTAAYMSPEQARGKLVDRRADIWAFGCVLFEMLVGQRAFGGEDVAVTLARVVEREPELDAMPPSVPARVTQVVRLCLQKDPKARIADVRDVRMALAGAFETAPVTADAKAGSLAWQGPLPWAAAAVLALAAAGLAWVLKPATASEPAPVVRFHHELGGARDFRNTNRRAVAVSPDGRAVVFNTTEGLFLLRVDALAAQPIPGTEGPVSDLAFSPDGEQLAYYSPANRRIERISVQGGTPDVVAEVEENPAGLSWTDDDRILFGGAQAGRVMSVRAIGGDPVPIFEHRGLVVLPQLLPGGDAVLFTTQGGLTRERAIWIASLESGEHEVLFPGHYARYVPTGHIVYGFEGALYARSFDLVTRTFSGPVRLLEDIRIGDSNTQQQFAVSRGGTLAYIPGSLPDSTGVAPGRTLAWVDRNNRETVLASGPRAFLDPRVSPDGARIAVAIADGQEAADIWIWHETRQTLTRLTFDEALDRAPLWSVDGTDVYFLSSREPSGIYRRPADGTGVAELVVAAPDPQITLVPWSTDGETLMVMQADLLSSPPAVDIGAVPLTGEAVLRLVLAEGFQEMMPSLSPNGRLLAYTSNESGATEVYVRAFPEVDAGGRWQISTSGGLGGVWASDGRELFYEAARRDGTRPSSNRLMVVPVTLEPAFDPGFPEMLLERPFFRDAVPLPQWDVSPDGQRFVFVKPPDAPAGDAADAEPADPVPPRVNVVVNWFEELKARVPVN